MAAKQTDTAPEPAEDFVMIRHPRAEPEKLSDINAAIDKELKVKQAEAEHAAKVAADEAAAKAKAEALAQAQVQAGTNADNDTHAI